MTDEERGERDQGGKRIRVGEKNRRRQEMCKNERKNEQKANVQKKKKQRKQCKPKMRQTQREL